MQNTVINQFIGNEFFNFFISSNYRATMGSNHLLSNVSKVVESYF